MEEKLKDLKVGNSNLTSEEAMDILSVIAHESMSKTQACKFLNVHSTRFQELIKEGVVPEGRKVLGFNEHRWYKDELLKVILKKRNST